MHENAATIGVHIATLVGIIGLLGVALKQHTVWVRMKDRINTLWQRHCVKTSQQYEPVEGGK